MKTLILLSLISANAIAKNIVTVDKNGKLYLQEVVEHIPTEIVCDAPPEAKSIDQIDVDLKKKTASMKKPIAASPVNVFIKRIK